MENLTPYNYVCTVYFVDFFISAQQMNNMYKKYFFLIALLHVSMFLNHPQTVCYYVR